jgi:hypothetical protein
LTLGFGGCDIIATFYFPNLDQKLTEEVARRLTTDTQTSEKSPRVESYKQPLVLISLLLYLDDRYGVVDGFCNIAANCNILRGLKILSPHQAVFEFRSSDFLDFAFRVSDFLDGLDAFIVLLNELSNFSKAVSLLQFFAVLSRLTQGKSDC